MEMSLQTHPHPLPAATGVFTAAARCPVRAVLTFSIQELAVPVHVRQEEAVDEGGFPQPRLPWGDGEQ